MKARAKASTNQRAVQIESWVTMVTFHTGILNNIRHMKTEIFLIVTLALNEKY